MANVILKSTIYSLVIMSAIIWFGLAWVNNLDLSVAKDFFSLVPKVVSVDLLLIALFVKWGWKLKLFRGWLVPFPNLNGTWTGHIYSNWVDEATGQKIAPIPAMLTIKQNFFTASFSLNPAWSAPKYNIVPPFFIQSIQLLKRQA